MRFALLILACLAGLVALTQAASLRDEIQTKLVVKSALYDHLNQDANLDPNDVINSFNSSATNTTNPIDAWMELPDWLRYLSGSIVALVCLIITFYGVRLLPLSVFLLGGFICAVIAYAILAASVPNDTAQKTAIVYGTAFGIWILAGVLLACCISLAVFILGAALGGILALVLNPIALKYVWPAEPLANTIIWVVVFAIVGGLIACCLKKPVLIAATSAGGAFGVVASIMLMCGGLNIAVSIQDGQILVTRWQDWAAFGGFIGLTILGVIVQLFCTARSGELDHYTKLD